MNANSLLQWFGSFVFLYPILMSSVWVIGGLYFWILYERKQKRTLVFQNNMVAVTILVPCYNEAKVMDKTCQHLQYLNYPQYEVLFLDDASTDTTVDIIRKYVQKVPQFKLHTLPQNAGKANALNVGLQMVDTPLVLVLDADTHLDSNTLYWMVRMHKENPHRGAVTGNVFIKNKASALAKLQAAEFTCIIGLIKRCQQMAQALFTVSGCATMYRLEALRNVGGFSTSTATEDVDMTWRLQRNGYSVAFEPNAKVFIQAPTSIKDYVKQRKRWATGGWHLLRQHANVLYDKARTILWIVYLEFAVSYLWAFCFVFFLLWNISHIEIDKLLHPDSYPGWSIAVVSLIFILQAWIALMINQTYDPTLKHSFLWICWYPLVFFAVGIGTIVWSTVKGLFQSTETSGRWSSPERQDI